MINLLMGRVCSQETRQANTWGPPVNSNYLHKWKDGWYGNSDAVSDWCLSLSKIGQNGPSCGHFNWGPHEACLFRASGTQPSGTMPITKRNGNKDRQLCHLLIGWNLLGILGGLLDSAVRSVWFNGKVSATLNWFKLDVLWEMSCKIVWIQAFKV